MGRPKSSRWSGGAAGEAAVLAAPSSPSWERIGARSASPSNVRPSSVVSTIFTCIWPYPKERGLVIDCSSVFHRPLQQGLGFSHALGREPVGTGARGTCLVLEFRPEVLREV